MTSIVEVLKGKGADIIYDARKATHPHLLAAFNTVPEQNREEVKDHLESAAGALGVSFMHSLWAILDEHR